MNWRLRVPSALYRLAVDKAGSDQHLASLVVGFLTRYVDGTTAAQQLASEGGKARAAKLTPEQRQHIARLGGQSGGKGRKSVPHAQENSEESDVE